MRRHGVRIAVIILSSALIVVSIIVLIARSSIDIADRTASVVAAIVGIAAAIASLYQSRVARTAARVAKQASDDAVLSTHATEDEFLTAWIQMEHELHRVTSATEGESAIPLKVLVKEYQGLPGVTQSDVEDILLLLRTRNGILHPNLGIGIGVGPSRAKFIAEAMNRQWKKIRTMEATS